MSEHFVKLWASILDSSVWHTPLHVKVCWITMLAMAEKDGYVGASIVALAARAGVSVEQCEEALKCFLSPDPYSRSKEHEGRKIEVADRGWRILNYEAHRERRDQLARREADAARKRDTRGRVRNGSDKSGMSAMSAHAEAEAEAEAEGTAAADGIDPSQAEGVPEGQVLSAADRRRRPGPWADGLARIARNTPGVDSPARSDRGA